MRKESKIPELLGTAEAADMLNVERPRIGRWMKAGVMPEPVQRVAATPLWTREQIEDLIESRRSYPWDEWLDGDIWRMTPGEDFLVVARSFKASARAAAKTRGLRTKIRECDGHVYVQAKP